VPVPGELDATLVLVRHGESAMIAEGRFQGRQDSPLTPLGERQARLVAARLAQRDDQTPLPIPVGPPTAVWHSPLSRAAQTARAIAGAQPTPVSIVVATGLIEIAQGEWEGRPQSDVRTRWAAELAAWRRTPLTSHAPGGESLAEAAERVSETLGEVFASLARTGAPSTTTGRDPVPGYATAAGGTPSDDPWAVLVAHDGIFRIVLLTLLDVPLERFWSFPFNLCAITVVTLHNGLAALRAHNLSEHLAPISAEARAAAEARGDRRGAL
jgi:phosphoserine phosphatase